VLKIKLFIEIAVSIIMTLFKLYRTFKGKTMTKKEPDRIDVMSIEDNKKLYYPLANFDCEEMITKGTYPKGYPEGAVVHFTAGRSKNGDKDAKNTISYGKRMGYCYFCIAADGSVFQPFPLNKWGHHAGKSSHPVLGDNLSYKLVGIEICNAGTLKQIDESKYESWFKEEYTKDEVRFCEGMDNIKKGFYHRYTWEQEKALTELIIWLKQNNPEVFKIKNVLGHDEIAPKRKSDPGASLSMTMPAYRNFLWRRYTEGTNAKIMEDGV